MKKLIYLIVIVLISSLALAGCSLLSDISQVPATEQSGIAYLTKGSSFTVGNDTTARVITDGYSNFTIIDTNNPSSDLGLLNTFSYYAANTNSFRFVLVDGSDVVKWVSDPITPPGTSAQIWLPLTPVYIEPDWNLGLYFASTGTVPYVLTGAPASYEPNNTGLPEVGDTLSYAGSSNRIYSFVATGEVAELPSVPMITWPEIGACITPAALTHIDWDDSTGTFTPLLYQYESYGNASYTSLLYSSSWLSASEISTSGSAERVYYIRVRAQDSMGNLSDWSNGLANPYKITVDKTPPVVTINAPADGGFYPVGGAVPALDYTVTDNLDPTPNVGVSDYDNYVAGEKIVTVTATDCAGNIGSDSVTYYVLENFVTGGGKINTLGGKKAAWTFAGTVGNLEDGSVGQFQIVDHANKITYHCNNDFSYLVFTGDKAEFTGNFTNNKNANTDELTIIIEDLGEPGAGVDKISVTGFITLSTTLISGGNFQVHDL